MAVEGEGLRDWHRLFGLLLTDFFTGSPFTVEIERDLSVQQQFLDVVIVRRRPGRFAGRLPDGLNDLAAHNLITFKSHQEALDGWALHELFGHYVSYRKLVSPAPNDLLPEADFHLYAVCARFPHNLSGRVPWEELQPGVYRCRWGTTDLRVTVARQLPEVAHNAPLHLFAADQERVRFGQGHYRPRSANTSTLLNQLLEKYAGEGLTMSYTMEDFLRDYHREHFAKLTPQQKREALAHMSPEEWRVILEPLPPEERLAGLSPEERLAGLSEEEVRQLLDRLSAGRPAKPRKPRRKK
jgi:hypothetical protein